MTFLAGDMWCETRCEECRVRISLIQVQKPITEKQHARMLIRINKAADKHKCKEIKKVRGITN